MATWRFSVHRNASRNFGLSTIRTNALRTPSKTKQGNFPTRSKKVAAPFALGVVYLTADAMTSMSVDFAQADRHDVGKPMLASPPCGSLTDGRLAPFEAFTLRRPRRD